MKLRIVILIALAIILSSAWLWAASLTSAQAPVVKPTDGGPIFLCPQFGNGACAWIIDTPEPVTMSYDWFRLRICEWLGACPAVPHG